MTWLRWLIRGLFCRHVWTFYRNIYGDEIIERGWKRSEWRCPKCGWFQLRGELEIERCEHGVIDGVYCKPCRDAYREAENDQSNGLVERKVTHDAT